VALNVLMFNCVDDDFSPREFGGSQMAQDILSVFAENLINSCDAAAQITEAQSVSLRLDPHCDSWTSLSARTSLVVQFGQCDDVVGTKIILPDFVMTETVANGHFVTDLVDLHVDLLSDSEGAVARLVLHEVQGNWKSKSCQRSLNAVSKIISADLLAIRNTPRMVATQFLTLIEQLADLDATVNVPSLTGFLRVLSDKAPTRSQLIALQISGLVESPNNAAPPITVTVTDAARDLLRQSGLNGLPTPSCTAQLPETVAADIPAPLIPTDLTPFARLRIMERDYLMAEDPATNALCYRSPEQTEWSGLVQTSADGWTTVAVEIIQSDIDVIAEFTRMHLLRRRDLPTDEIAEAFEILGVIFWLRRSATSTEMRIDGADWTELEVAADAPLKERAIHAAFALHAKMGIGLDKAARDWAARMAQAAQVTPYMGIAAQ
jgi:hypothetical protein